MPRLQNFTVKYLEVLKLVVKCVHSDASRYEVNILKLQRMTFLFSNASVRSDEGLTLET